METAIGQITCGSCRQTSIQSEEPGTLTICTNCLTVGIVQEDGLIHKPSETEIEAIRATQDTKWLHLNQYAKMLAEKRQNDD